MKYEHILKGLIIAGVIFGTYAQQAQGEVDPIQPVGRVKSPMGAIGDPWKKQKESGQAVGSTTGKPKSAHEQYEPYVPKYKSLTEAQDKIDTNSIIKILKLLSAAAETYATTNDGNYPTNDYDLIKAQPPYIARNYCGQDINGFVLSCEWWTEGYLFRAVSNLDQSEILMKTGGMLEMDESETKKTLEYWGDGN